MGLKCNEGVFNKNKISLLLLIFNFALSTNPALGLTTNSGTVTFTGTQTPSNDYNNTATGIIKFNDSSSLSSHFIANYGTLTFNDSSTGATGTINNYGDVEFNDTSGRGSCFIYNLSSGTITFNNTGANQRVSGIYDIVNNSGSSIIFNQSATFQNSSMNNLSNVTFDSNSSLSNGSIDNSDTLIFDANSNAGVGTINNSSGANLTFTGGSGASMSTINNNGTLVFKGNSTATSSIITTNGTTNFLGNASGGSARMITNSGGLVDISGIFGSSIAVGSIEGAGNYHLGNKNMIVGGNNLSTIVSGIISNDFGTLTKTGTGTMVLSGNNTYVGGTDIQQGVLQVDGSIMSPVTIESAGTLSGIGTINGNVSNSGTIAPGNSAAAGVLTINGNYVGNNGKLNIRLMNNDNDVLVINNTTPVSGTTYVTLSGSGGKVSQNGIQIIETAGSEENAFVLSNPTMGAYNYKLRLGGYYTPDDNDWYLDNSARQVRDVVVELRDDLDIFSSIAPIVQQYNTDSMQSLNNGYVNDIDLSHRNWVWTKVFGNIGKRQGSHFQSNVGYKFSTMGLQIGRDIISGYSLNEGRYIAGLYGSVGRINGKIVEDQGEGVTNVNAYSFGGYATYNDPSKFQADFIAQATKYDISSTTFIGDKITPNAFSFEASAALSYPIILPNKLTLKPQAQIIYQHIDIQNTRNNTLTVSFNDNNSLKTKMGGTLSYDVQTDTYSQNKNSKKGIITPEISLNYWHEFKKKSTININNSIVMNGVNDQDAVAFSNKNLTNWFDYGLGIKGYAADNIQIYASANYQASTNFKSYVSGGKIGVKINL